MISVGDDAACRVFANVRCATAVDRALGVAGCRRS